MKYFVAPGEDRRLTPAARAKLRGQFIALSDGITHYELSGPEGGQLVVMAGGLTVPLFYWDEMAAHLHGRGLQTLTYSAYGRGYSERVDTAYDQELFVRQLAELVDIVGEGRPHHLVGTSMGALVAMAHLQAVPSNTALTLTLVGPAGLSRPPLPQRLLLGNDLMTTVVARTIGRRVLDQHLGHNVREPRRAVALRDMVAHAFRYEGSLYAFFSTLRNFGLFDRGELYRCTGQLAVPTLLVWGDDDEVTPITALDRVVAMLRPEDTRIIDNCGHMAPFERPREVATALADFAAAHTERLSS
jgi:pimeloyl-ACP methyl ester carboxylesterase